jgi:hypothetical protein
MESERVRACLKKAAECEERAVLVGDDATRETYRELASQWLRMAKEVEELERARPVRPVSALERSC